MQEHPYAGRTVAFLTQHGKERVVAPVLAEVPGCRVELVGGFDTDTLGTFTREIPREGTQLEAARRKARIATERSGLGLGLGSEGSFGPDPQTGFLPWNVELLVFWDEGRGIEIVGVHQGPAPSDHAWVQDWPGLEDFAKRVGFPGQQLVLRPGREDDPRVRKGLADWDALAEAFERARRADGDGTAVLVERDLRAHAHPLRMENIARAARDLAQKLASRCPGCLSPGFAAVRRLPGLPCGECGAPTREHRGTVLACPACEHREEREREDGASSADPARCDSCNP